MSSNDSPKGDMIEKISKGMTEGTLDWTWKKLKPLVTKLRNRELAFIEDIETINLAKEQRTKSEWAIFSQYIKFKDFRILFQLGLTLRTLEEKNIPLEPLRKKIINKYDIDGLHIAQFVQNGMLNKYLGSVLDKITTPNRLKSEIEKLFYEINKRVIFIQARDNVKKKTDEAVSKINANSPKIFIISSTKSAMPICKKIEENVMKKISGYSSELYRTQDKRIYFLIKSEDIDILKEK